MSVGNPTPADGIFTQAICPTIQMLLDDSVGRDITGSITTPVGGLNAILSEYNRKGMKLNRRAFNQDSMGGISSTQHQLELVYYQRFSEADVVGNVGDICEAGTVKEPFSITFTPSQSASVKIELDNNQMKLLCQGRAEWFVQNQLKSALKALYEGIDTAITTQIIPNVGLYEDGSSTLIAPPLGPLAAGGMNGPNMESIATFLEAYSVAGGWESPIIVGAGDMYKYTHMIGQGCCNALGQNLEAAIRDFAYFQDSRYSTLIGDGKEHYLAFAPGAIQLATYNQFLDYQQMNLGTYESSTIQDPRANGLTFDIERKFDPCTKRWTILISVQYELIIIPPDFFGAADPLNGVNYIFDIKKSA